MKMDDYLKHQATLLEEIRTATWLCQEKLTLLADSALEHSQMDELRKRLAGVSRQAQDQQEIITKLDQALTNKTKECDALFNRIEEIQKAD